LVREAPHRQLSFVSEDQQPARRPTAFPGPVRFNQFLAWGARLYWAELGRLVPLFFVGYLVAMSVGAAGGATRRAVASVDLVIYLVTVLSLAMVGSVLVVIAGVLMAGNLAGEPPSLADALGMLKGRMRDVVAGALIVGAIAIPALQIFGDFGLVFVFMLLGPPVVGHVIALERKRLKDAWPRAKSLLAGHTARIFLYLWSVALLLTLIMLVGWISAFNVAAELGGAAGAAAGLALAAAVAGILMPFLAALSLVVYFDLRPRIEDFDLQKLRTQLRASEA
jgi:hypothetical protein